MQYKPHDYQEVSKNHILDNPYCALFLEMGLGKTAPTLSAISDLLDRGEITKVLVIAPLRVADMVWTAERNKWDHLQHLKISKVLGTEKQRKKALSEKAHIYVINRENVVWLMGQLKGSFPFDMMVIDELSSFKSPSSARFKALKVILPLINRIVGLTGTPQPNSLRDLWSQLYLLDRGVRLGKSMAAYTDMYFNPGQGKGHVVYNYTLKGKRKKDELDPVIKLLGTDIYEKEIHSKISDICISMKSDDYLDLPERLDRILHVPFSEALRKQYRDFERDCVLELEGEQITAVNAAVLAGKLIQFANGALYVQQDNSAPLYKEVHNAKLEALEEIIDISTGSVLVAYWFQHDLARLKRRFPKGRVLKSNKDFDDWNDGKIDVGFIHPASAGHGLNLQAGGNTIVWFSMIWSLELYQQLNKRLHRQGQLNAVIIHHLIVPDTMDQVVWERIGDKEAGQNRLFEGTKAIINRVRKELLRIV